MFVVDVFLAFALHRSVSVQCFRKTFYNLLKTCLLKGDNVLKFHHRMGPIAMALACLIIVSMSVPGLPGHI